MSNNKTGDKVMREFEMLIGKSGQTPSVPLTMYNFEMQFIKPGRLQHESIDGLFCEKYNSKEIIIKITIEVKSCNGSAYEVLIDGINNKHSIPVTLKTSNSRIDAFFSIANGAFVVYSKSGEVSIDMELVFLSDINKKRFHTDDKNILKFKKYFYEQ